MTTLMRLEGEILVRCFKISRYAALLFCFVTVSHSVLAGATAHANIDDLSLLIIDMRPLKLCFSKSLNVFTEYIADYADRPSVEIIIGNAPWQLTSVRALSSFYKIDIRPDDNNTLMQPFFATPNKHPCLHANTQEEEQDFYAPTGNGSTVTKVTCIECGFVLRRKSVYSC